MSRFPRVSLLAPVAVAISLFSTSAFAELFMSEYIEGGGNNKAIEIYNPDGSTVDLNAGDYELLFYFNGNTTASTTIDLTGSVASGDVYVVADNNSVAAILNVTDQQSTASFLTAMMRSF